MIEAAQQRAEGVGQVQPDGAYAVVLGGTVGLVLAFSYVMVIFLIAGLGNFTQYTTDNPAAYFYNVSASILVTTFMAFVIGFGVGIFPGLIIGAFTAWLTDWFISRFFSALSSVKSLTLGITLSLGIVLIINICIFWLGDGFKQGSILVAQGFILGLPSLIYIAAGGWGSRKLYLRKKSLMISI